MAMESLSTAAAATTTTDSTVAAALQRRESLSQSFAATGSSNEPPTAELARNLPALVEQLRLLRTEMEKSAKIYDAITAGDIKTHQPVTNSNSNSNSHTTAMRPSIFTPFELDSPPDASTPIDDRDSVPLDLHDLAGHTALQRPHSNRNVVHQQQQQPHTVQVAYPQYHQQQPLRRIDSASRRLRTGDYTVMWVSGECGISLRNFSTNKIGAQIAVLQQADGVTTGIATCRLGDQLVSVNDDVVETAAFRDIVQKLKTTRRPITLGFRTNPNVATSPTAGPTMRTAQRARPSGSGGGSTRSFFPQAQPSQPQAQAQAQAQPAPVDDEWRSKSQNSADESDPTSRYSYSYSSSSSYRTPLPRSAPSSLARSSSSAKIELDAAAADASSLRSSSTSTLSDEVESWCKEQEEMHSGLLLLLTETVLRCEKLQQENMDQLQNWMHVAPSLYSSAGTMNTTIASTPALEHVSERSEDGAV